MCDPSLAVDLDVDLDVDVVADANVVAVVCLYDHAEDKLATVSACTSTHTTASATTSTTTYRPTYTSADTSTGGAHTDRGPSTQRRAEPYGSERTTMSSNWAVAFSTMKPTPPAVRMWSVSVVGTVYVLFIAPFM